MSLMKSRAGCLILSLAATFCMASAVAQAPKVVVGGLAIAKPDPDDEYGGAMSLSLRPGTTVYLRAMLDDRTVIGLQNSEKNPFKMEDSEGKSLEIADQDVDFASTISDDGKYVDFSVSSSALPSSKAQALQVSGAIVAVCGARPKTDEVDVKIASNSKFKMAGISFKVSDVSDSFLSDNAQTFEIEAKKSLAQIQKLQAVLENGKTVDLVATGSSKFGFNNNMTFSRSYDVSGQASDIQKLKVTYFQGVENVDVPFEMKVGLGLNQ